MDRRCRISPPAIVGAAIGAAVAGFAMLAFTGLGIRRPVSRRRPASSVDHARQRVDEVRRAEEAEGVFSASHTTLLTPADPVPGTPTIVLMHGLTMTPDQFMWIGGVMRDAGYRVLLPRMPDHGRLDRSAHLLADVRGDDLTAWADSVIDIAAGFGAPVWVMGLSAGGLLACWCARVRPEVERVVAIAPFTAPHGFRWFVVRLAARLEGWLPTTTHYWDEELREEADISPYGYTGFPIRGASAYMRISEALYDSRLQPQPYLQRAALIINEGDDAVSAPRARELFRRAFSGDAEIYDEITLPASFGWEHDFIDSWLHPRPDPQAVLEILLGALGMEGPEVEASIRAYRTEPRQL